MRSVFALLPFALVTFAADTLYFNGEVVTMDGTGRTAATVGVRNGLVAAAGSKEDVRRALGPSVLEIDLQGRTLLPGFYAAHDHFPSSGNTLYSVDLNSPPIGVIRNIDELVAALKKKAALTPAGKWVTGRGYDDTLLRENRHPTREDLDQVSTAHPIWVVHISGHLGAANSRALAIAGITKATQQPAGGRIRMDFRGEPNGVFEESLGLISRHIPGHTPAERQAAIRKAQEDYLARGVTTTAIAGVSAQTLRDLETASAAGVLKLRIAALINSAAAEQNVKTAAARDRIHLTGVKLLQDGSLQGYTGYLSAAYYKQPEGMQDYSGYALQTREVLVRTVRKLHAMGQRVAVHGNGDAAIDDILEAFAVALKESPRPDARHRIEHCQTPRDDQILRMKELGVTPSYFNGHVYYWGDRHRDIFLGPRRAAQISPLATSLRRGLRFTIHNDTPVTPVDPLLLVWTAVNRLTKDGKVLGAGESIPALAALRAVTIDAAWQNFEEKERGSIEPGKFADFVIVDRNPLRVSPKQIREVQVLETIIGGVTVYKR